MNKQNKGQFSWPDMILAGILACIIIVMIVQVFFRYVLNQSLYWSEEIVRYLFVWFVFLGGAIVLRDNDHIGIDYFIRQMPVRMSRNIEKFNLLCVICLSLFFIVVGFIWVYKIRESYSPALGLPVNWLLYGALPATSILSLIFGIKWLLKSRNQKNHQYKDGGTII